MRRKTFDTLMSTTGLVAALILAVVGGLGLWANHFVSDQVRSQLTQQKIEFPTVAAIKAQGNADITKYVTPYAGQQVTTGKQAEVFADHYIANHLKGMANGQTYSEVSAAFLKMAPTDPDYAKVAQLRQTLFMGETLRGMLLNAYAFGTMATIAGIAAIASFIAAGVMLLLSALGFAHRHRVTDEAQLHLGSRTPAPVEL